MWGVAALLFVAMVVLVQKSIEWATLTHRRAEAESEKANWDAGRHSDLGRWVCEGATRTPWNVASIGASFVACIIAMVAYGVGVPAGFAFCVAYLVAATALWASLRWAANFPLGHACRVWDVAAPEEQHQPATAADT